jgi:uncharacterized protein YidB (DUF937 family)
VSFLDNIFGSGPVSSVASRYLRGGSKAQTPGFGFGAGWLTGRYLGGLGDLLEQLQKKVLGDAADSRVNTGPNKSVTPGQISKAINPDIIEALSQRVGLSKEQISQILAQFLPNAVDEHTPEGRLPTARDLSVSSI